ncbi:MAG: sensor histidine kinase [Gemmatimonadaceae bacterium]
MPLTDDNLAVASDPLADFALRVLRSAPVVVVALHLDGRIQYVNPFFERLTGHQRGDLQGTCWFDTVIPDRDRARIRALFSQSVGGRHVRGHVNAIVTRSGQERQIEWTDGFLRNDDGQQSVLAIGLDVTARGAAEIQHRSTLNAMHEDRSLCAGETQRQAATRIRDALAEKETLLREMHHRVKNNLQVVAGLLHFQAKKLQVPEDAEAFRDIRQRIMAMALVHERLYGARDLARVDIALYVHSLIDELTRSLAPPAGVRIGVMVDNIALPIELAMPCGIIVNELLTNTCKYAFPDARPGTTTLQIRRTDDEQVVLTLDDDGVGFPADFSPADGGSFGWELVRTLVMQIGGTVTATTDRGAHVRIAFPMPAPGGRSPC